LLALMVKVPTTGRTNELTEFSIDGSLLFAFVVRAVVIPTDGSDGRGPREKHMSRSTQGKANDVEKISEHISSDRIRPMKCH